MSNPGEARYGFIRIAFAQILAVTQYLAVFTIVLSVLEDNFSKSDLNSPPPNKKIPALTTDGSIYLFYGFIYFT